MLARSRQCTFIRYIESCKTYRYNDPESGRIIVGSKEKFYESNSVPRTLSAYTEQNVFHTLSNSCTNESARGADVVYTEASVDMNGDEEFSDHSGVPEVAYLQETSLEEEPSVRRSDRQRQSPPKLTYEHALTDNEDADVANMFELHEHSTYEEAIMDDYFDKWTRGHA